MESGAVGFGGVCGRIGIARPTSVCPLAFSTLGLLKRLNKDILDDERSSFGAGAWLDAFDATEDERAASCRFAVERVRRHLETGLDKDALERPDTSAMVVGVSLWLHRDGGVVVIQVGPVWQWEWEYRGQ